MQQAIEINHNALYITRVLPEDVDGLGSNIGAFSNTVNIRIDANMTAEEVQAANPNVTVICDSYPADAPTSSSPKQKTKQANVKVKSKRRAARLARRLHRKY